MSIDLCLISQKNINIHCLSLCFISYSYWAKYKVNNQCVSFSLGKQIDLDNKVTGRSLMQSEEPSSKSQNFIRNINLPAAATP